MFDIKEFLTEQSLLTETRLSLRVKILENAVLNVKHELNLLKRESRGLRNREIERQIHEMEMIVARLTDKVKAVLSVIEDEA